MKRVFGTKPFGATRAVSGSIGRETGALLAPMEQGQDAQDIWLFKPVEEHVVRVRDYGLVDCLFLDEARSLGIGRQEAIDKGEDAILDPKGRVNGPFGGDIGDLRLKLASSGFRKKDLHAPGLASAPRSLVSSSGWETQPPCSASATAVANAAR